MKPIQICPIKNTMQGVFAALCDDGSIWIYGGRWHKIPPIPEQDKKDEEDIGTKATEALGRKQGSGARPRYSSFEEG